MERAELLVAVLLSWQLPPPEQVALLETCSRAFASGRCVAVTADAAAGAPLWARIDRRSEREMRVTVEDRRLGGTATRRLHFQAADTDRERAKAVGLAVGVLARELARTHQSPSHELEPAPVDASPASEGSVGGSSFDGLVSAQLGVGWDHRLAEPEVGGALRGGWRLARSAWRAGLGIDGWWTRTHGPDGVWLQRSHGALWVGWSYPLGNLELSGAADLALQWLRVSTASPLPRDRDGRVVPVLRASGQVTYWLGRHWGIAATAEVAWATSATDIFVREEVMAHVGRLRIAGLLGPAVRWGGDGD